MAGQSKKTSIRPVIFDTDLLVWYFRGNAPARERLLRTERDRRWISSLSLMELYQGARSREEMLDIQGFVAENISRILHPKTAISEKAIHLIETFSLSHGLRVIDALIGATALVHRASLSTGNQKHFRCMSGLEIRPFRP